MGGSQSHEFMVLTDAGEDLVAECPQCRYAANLEKATSRLPAIADEAGLEGMSPCGRDACPPRALESALETFALLIPDEKRRLVSACAAAVAADGRVTQLKYEHPVKPLLVTSIIDPFSRSAVFTYDGSYRLSSIQDAQGITASFTYEAGSTNWISGMTTPFGPFAPLDRCALRQRARR